MDAWEGAFSWQGYALEGRPDLLNYLYRGDVTWEQVWQLYRERPAKADAVLRISGLFLFGSEESDSVTVAGRFHGLQKELAYGT